MDLDTVTFLVLQGWTGSLDGFFLDLDLGLVFLDFWTLVLFLGLVGF
jgi:hypothetical protein